MEVISSDERQIYYKGMAKIKLGHLVFDNGDVKGGRCLDKRNVRRLVEVFRIEGCKPYEPEHRISALVSRQQLQEALDLSGILETDLRQQQSSPRELHFNTDRVLQCLYGKHRIEAAQIFHEDSRDKWWIIELYDDGLYFTRR